MITRGGVERGCSNQTLDKATGVLMNVLYRVGGLVKIHQAVQSVYFVSVYFAGCTHSGRDELQSGKGKLLGLWHTFIILVCKMDSQMETYIKVHFKYGHFPVQHFSIKP